MEIKELDQFRYGLDLIGFVPGLDPAQEQAILSGPGPDYMQWRFVRVSVVAAPEPLAVEGDNLSVGDIKDALRPGQEARLKLLGGNKREDASDGVMRGNAMRESEEASEPFLFGVSVFFDGSEAVGAADGATDRQHEDVMEAVKLAMVASWIFELAEVGGNRGRGGCLHRPSQRMGSRAEMASRYSQSDAIALTHHRCCGRFINLVAHGGAVYPTSRHKFSSIVC